MPIAASAEVGNAAAVPGLGEGLTDCINQGFAVVEGDKAAEQVRVDEFAVAAYVRRDDGAAAGEGLGDGVAPALGLAGQGEEVGGVQESCEPPGIDAAEQGDRRNGRRRRLPVDGLDGGTDATGVGPISGVSPDEDQPYVAGAAADLGPDRDEAMPTLEGL